MTRPHRFATLPSCRLLIVISSSRRADPTLDLRRRWLQTGDIERWVRHGQATFHPVRMTCQGSNLHGRLGGTRQTLNDLANLRECVRIPDDNAVIDTTGRQPPAVCPQRYPRYGTNRSDPYPVTTPGPGYRLRARRGCQRIYTIRPLVLRMNSRPTPCQRTSTAGPPCHLHPTPATMPLQCRRCRNQPVVSAYEEVPGGRPPHGIDTARVDRQRAQKLLDAIVVFSRLL